MSAEIVVHTMVKIRKKFFEKAAFASEIYTPGVISGTRMIWASIGGSIAVTLIAALSLVSGVPLLVPPIAASCFIAFAIPRVRLARPKNIIGSHALAAVCGNLSLYIFGLTTGPPGLSWARVGAVGTAVFLAIFLMILTDTDQPPATATAVVSALFAQPNWFFVATVAGGAAIVALVATLWNRVWIDYPPR